MQGLLRNKPYEIEGECVDLPISNLGLKWVAWAIILVYTYKQMNEHTYILTYNSLFVYMHTYRQTDIQADRQTVRQSVRQTERQEDRQTERRTF